LFSDALGEAITKVPGYSVDQAELDSLRQRFNETCNPERHWLRAHLSLRLGLFAKGRSWAAPVGVYVMPDLLTAMQSGLGSGWSPLDHSRDLGVLLEQLLLLGCTPFDQPMKDYHCTPQQLAALYQGCAWSDRVGLLE
jgi:hypothetical protein